MESDEAAVCTWCRRPVAVPRRQPQPPAEPPGPRRTTSNLQVFTTVAALVLFVVVIALITVLMQRQGDVVQNGPADSSPGSTTNDPARNAPPPRAPASAPSAAAPGRTVTPGSRPTAGRQAPGMGRTNPVGGNGMTYGKPGPIPIGMPVSPGTVFSDHPALAFKFEEVRRDAPGARFAVEFHSVIDVTNQDTVVVDYVRLPTLELVFDDGSSITAKPIVWKSSDAAKGGKATWAEAQAGEATIAPADHARVEYAVGAADSPASRRVISASLALASGPTDLPLPS